MENQLIYRLITLSCAHIAFAPLLTSAPISKITVSRTAAATGSVNHVAAVPNQAGASYFWTISNGAIAANATNTNTITFGVSHAGETVLTCTVTDATKLSSTGTCKIAVVDPPDVTIKAPGYVGQDEIITASVREQTGCKYSWTVEAGSIVGPSDGNTVSFTSGNNSSVTPQVAITNALGITLRGAKAINVLRKPKINGISGFAYANSAHGYCHAGITSLNNHILYKWSVPSPLSLQGGKAPAPYGLNREGSEHPDILASKDVVFGSTYPVSCTVTDYVGQSATGEGYITIQPATMGVSAPRYITPGDFNLTGLIEQENGYDCYVDKINNGKWGPGDQVDSDGSDVYINNSDIYSCNFNVKPTVMTNPSKIMPYKLTASLAIKKGGGNTYPFPLLISRDTWAVYPPIATITAPVYATEWTREHIASVPFQYCSFPSRYLWGISNGWITSGLGTSTIRYQVRDSSKPTGLSCTVINFADRSITGRFDTQVVPAPISRISVPRLSETTGSTNNTASVPLQGGTAYSWGISGGQITSGLGTDAISYTVTAGDGGNVKLTCTVTNAAGTKDIGVQSLSIAAPPAITAFTAAENPILVGNPTVNTITPVFSNGKGVIDQGIGEAISGRSYDISPTATTTYTLTVTNCAGTAVSETLKVTVDPGFYATGSLVLPRENHEAILLENELVLIGGGDNGTYSLLPTELYVGAAFTQFENIDVARGCGSAVRLASGNALFSGGFTTSPWLPNSVDSTSILVGNRFLPGALMGTARRVHTTTLLQDGRVLVVGGQDQNGDFLNSAVILDKTGGVSCTPTTNPMAKRRAHHTATLLPDGTVLIYGGRNAEEHAISSAQLFDPKTNTFGPEMTMLPLELDPLPKRTDHQATLLDPSGFVLISGGKDESGKPSSSLIVYQAVLKEFFIIPNTNAEPRALHTATLLPDGKVLLAGGQDTHGNPTDTAEIFDPVARKTSSVAGMVSGARYGHRAILLPNNKVLMTGGIINGEVTSSAELFDTATNEPGPLILIFAVATSPETNGNTLLYPAFIGAKTGDVFISGDSQHPFKSGIINGKPFETGPLPSGQYVLTLRVEKSEMSLILTIP